jgi:asparagine synthase (glutamine-hydrolysing)
VCGICGIVRLDAPPEREIVERMTGILVHRGPDAEGVYAAPGVALGSRRLAILDLSDEGAQPFASDDGRFRLVHNGEIYNYRELRTELEGKGRSFRSGTDTEVVLKAYEEWGEACVRRFNGMWAFAIWDSERRELFASRDRAGVKPFYYSVRGDRLAFASEPKAFRADPDTDLRPNPRVVRDYLERGYVEHTDGTFFDGIVKLPAAHSLRFAHGKIELRRYWQLEPGEMPSGDPVEKLRELFLDAVRLRLRSDVTVGTALSGGLDSSAIVCAVDHLRRKEPAAASAVGERQATFTVYFDGGRLDERPYARAVTDAAAVDAHWISFSAADVIDNLPAIVASQDEPFASTSMIAQWFVMREAARAGVTVMLDGQGGDEVLAGYPYYFGFRFADLLREGHVVELASEIAAYRSLHGAGVFAIGGSLARPFLPAALKWRLRSRVAATAPLVHPELRALPPTPPRAEHAFRDRLRSQLHLIFAERGLPALLRYEDRNSMAHSIEARLPFLDYRLVEFLFCLSGDFLIHRGRTKEILRHALSDLLPPLVRERVDKVGFETPEAEWFRGPLGDLAEDVFSSRPFAQRGFYDAAAVRRHLERHRDGNPAKGYELWRALNLELWSRELLDAPSLAR